MKNLYKLGLDSQSSWFPSVFEHRRNQAGEIVAGLSMAHRGGLHMYNIGATASEKQGPVAPTMDNVVEWASDALMGLLLVGGVLITMGALKYRDDSK